LNFVPSGLGANTAFKGTGKLISYDLHPPKVKQWKRILFEGDGLTSDNFEYSTDKGKTWRRLLPGGSLMAADNKVSFLRLRVSLHNSQAALQSIKVLYRGESWKYRFNNRQFAMDLDLSTGGICELKHLETNTTLLRSPNGIIPFDFKQRSTSGKIRSVEDSIITFNGYSVKRHGSSNFLELDYTVSSKEEKVKVTCFGKIDDGDELAYWKIRIQNKMRNREIVEARFPILNNVRINSDGRKDYLIFPDLGGGEKIPDPYMTDGRTGVYAGSASMPWMDLYTGNWDKENSCGLYFASYDRTLLLTGLDVKPDPANGTLQLSMMKFAKVTPNETWNSKDYVIGVHRGDWHHAADIYRQWARGWMPAVKYPDWVKNCDGLVIGKFLLPEHKFLTYIPYVYSVAEELGLNWIQFWGQQILSTVWGHPKWFSGESKSRPGCDRLTFPDPALGTENDFENAIRSVIRKGGHVGFYLNAMAWDPRWPENMHPAYRKMNFKFPEDCWVPDWEKGFKDNVAANSNGSFKEQYPFTEEVYRKDMQEKELALFGHHLYPCEYYVMCPASDGWKNYITYWCKRYSAQYGADCQYLDQLTHGYCCYNPKHRHNQPGASTQGYLDILKRIKAENPQLNVFIENTADIYGPYAIFQAYPVSTGVWPYSYPVLQYTFPEFIFFDGNYEQYRKWPRTQKEIANNVYLHGNRFEFKFFKTEGLKRDEDDFINYYKKVIALRKSIKKYLYPASFMDDVGLKIKRADIQAKLFIGNHGIAVINICNPKQISGATGEFEINRYNTSARNIRYVTLEDNHLRPLTEENIKRVSGKLIFTIPKSILSTLIISDGRMKTK
jgi:hypothetical protein